VEMCLFIPDANVLYGQGGGKRISTVCDSPSPTEQAFPPPLSQLLNLLPKRRGETNGKVVFCRAHCTLAAL